MDAADWATEACARAKNKETMDGSCPADLVTRQELAVVLTRPESLDEGT